MLPKGYNILGRTKSASSIFFKKKKNKKKKKKSALRYAGHLLGKNIED